MRVFVSVAVTADGAMDDCSAERLRISGPEDWAQVVQLRSQYDAILVGAETVRRDNPRLVIFDEKLRAQRIALGLEPDIVKVTVTRSGRLPREAEFFTCGGSRKIVFSEVPIPALDGAAEVIVEEEVSAALIVTHLEKLGLQSLFVEGGEEVLRLFFAEGMADTLRLSVNGDMTVPDACAPRLRIGDDYLASSHFTETVGCNKVTTYTLRPYHPEDGQYLQQAIDVSRNCTPDDGSYCVGAVIVTCDGQLFTGYTHETSPTHHAEQEAAAKAKAAGADLRGATIYSSMEPCSSRKSEPESCSEMILRLGFARVVFAAYEPDCFVSCRGALNLRRSRVEVCVMPTLAGQVRQINSHVWR